MFIPLKLFCVALLSLAVIVQTDPQHTDLWQRQSLEQKNDVIIRQVTTAIKTTSSLPQGEMAVKMLSIRLERDVLIMSSNHFRTAMWRKLERITTNPERKDKIRDLLAASELTYESLPLTKQLPLYLTNRWTLIHRQSSVAMMTSFLAKLHEWNEDIANNVAILRSNVSLHLDTLYVMASQFYRQLIGIKQTYVQHITQSDKWHTYVLNDIIQKTRPSLPNEMVDAIADRYRLSL